MAARAAVLGAALVVVAACGDRRVPAIGMAATLQHPGVVEVAREDLAARGLDSTRLRIIEADDRPDLASEVQKAAFLSATREVVGVVGHSGSRGTLLGAPIYADSGIAVVVPNATSRRLAESSARLFRLAPDDSVEGAFMAAFAVDSLRARAITIVYVNDEFGIGIRDGVVAALDGRGVAVVDAVPVGAGSCPPMVPDDAFTLTLRATLRVGRPDVVMIAAAPQTTPCIAAGMRRLVPGVRVIVADGTEPNRDFAIRAGATGAEGTYFVAFWHPVLADSAGRAFLAAFRRVAGRDPDASEALWYDGLMLLGAAVQEGGPSRAQVAGWLQSLGIARPAYRGITGPITFDAPRVLSIVMLQVQGANLRVAYHP